MAKGVAFTAESAKRIGRVVQTVERTGPPPSGRQSQSPSAGPPWSLARAQESFSIDGTGKVKLFGGKEKGAELDLDKEVDCYSRFHEIDEGDVLLIINIGGGWEVLQIQNTDPREDRSPLRTAMKIDAEGEVVQVYLGASGASACDVNDDKLYLATGATDAYEVHDVGSGNYDETIYGGGAGSSGATQHIAVDATQVYYIGNDGKLVARNKTTFVLAWTKTGHFCNTVPGGLHIDATTGHIYAATSAGCKVYDTAGTLLLTISGITFVSGGPNCIKTDPSGNIYLSGLKSGGPNVWKYDSSGTVVWTAFVFTGFTVLATSIDVLSTGDVVVGTFSSSGRVGVIDGATGAVQMWTDVWTSSVWGLAVDEDDNIYACGGDALMIASSFRRRSVNVRKYDSAGNIVWTMITMASNAFDPKWRDGHLFLCGGQTGGAYARHDS